MPFEFYRHSLVSLSAFWDVDFPIPSLAFPRTDPPSTWDIAASYSGPCHGSDCVNNLLLLHVYTFAESTIRRV